MYFGILAKNFRRTIGRPIVDYDDIVGLTQHIVKNSRQRTRIVVSRNQHTAVELLHGFLKKGGGGWHLVIRFKRKVKKKAKCHIERPGR